MGRGISFFPLKNFSLTVPQNFVGTINVSEIFGYRKTLRIRRGCHYSTLTFLPHSAKKSVFRENSGIENFHDRSGDATMVCRIFFVSQDRQT